MPPQSDGTRGFCFGGFFHMLRSGRHERVRGGGFKSAARGDHGSGHAAPCHLRRDGTREVGFCFSLEVAPVSEGDCFTRSRVTARGVGRCRGGGALIKTPKPPVGGFGNCRIETGTTNIGGCERSYFRSALIRSDFRPAPNRSASELYHIFRVKYIFENTRISPYSPPFTKRNNYRS